MKWIISIKIDAACSASTIAIAKYRMRHATVA